MQHSPSRDLLIMYCMTYILPVPSIDDVFISSFSMEENIKQLQLVFERFDQFGVVINHVKCEFGKSEVIFLCHHINSAGISPSSSKVETIS